MAMEPYLPVAAVQPLLLPPPASSTQPLQCPHGFWNAPGSKGGRLGILWGRASEIAVTWKFKKDHADFTHALFGFLSHDMMAL